MAMDLRPAFVALLMTMLAASDLAAQPAAPPVEDVTVTGTRTRQAIEGFIQSLAKSTRITDKIARWEKPICPVTMGLNKKFAAFISQHVKDIAAKVGAPVNAKTDCKPNIAIVFTTAPDALLANIRKNQREYLGYYDNMDQLDALAQFTRPLQSWYTTETVDLHGQAVVDSGRGGGLTITVPDLENPGRFETMVMPAAYGRAVTGTRLGDGLHTGFFNVLIVAEPANCWIMKSALCPIISPCWHWPRSMCPTVASRLPAS